MRAKRPIMPRPISWLLTVACAALLASWPLWHVTRPSGCTAYPCDPAIEMPFAYEALALDVVAILAFLVVATWLVAAFIGAIIRHDARVRGAHRAAGG